MANSDRDTQGPVYVTSPQCCSSWPLARGSLGTAGSVSRSELEHSARVLSWRSCSKSKEAQNSTATQHYTKQVRGSDRPACFGRVLPQTISMKDRRVKSMRMACGHVPAELSSLNSPSFHSKFQGTIYHSFDGYYLVVMRIRGLTALISSLFSVADPNCHPAFGSTQSRVLPKGPMKVPNERMVFSRTCFAQLS